MPSTTTASAAGENAYLRTWAFGDRRLQLGHSPLFMGILNVTPDSFSDGGTFTDAGVAVEHALKLVEQGADLIDVGGESTRPGATPVPLADELARVLPVITRLASAVRVPISIDTYKAEVARQALQAGATIVNDISGLTFDPSMIPVCAASDCGIICMHIQGTPQTMQDNPHYVDVVSEISAWLDTRLHALEQAGVARERVVLDPGVGFGKTSLHNVQILSQIARLRALGRPVCVGHSRKRFLKSIVGRPVDDRLFATVGVSVALAAQHTDIIRVHDVAASRDAVAAWEAIMSGPVG